MMRNTELDIAPRECTLYRADQVCDIQVLCRLSMLIYRRALRYGVDVHMDARVIVEAVFRTVLKPDMHLLKSRYIRHAPLLRHLADDLFSRTLPSLRTLRIVHTGLEDIPRLHRLRTNSILHMVDLDNNMITRIPSSAVRVRSEQFLLNYNLIEEIHENAFNGSEIAELSLKGNRRLRHIHPKAFVGLRSLRILDVSRTAIGSLPTVGLRELEVLRLQDTDTLKVIPSIFNFEHLREAWLTYPYHCCAFQFPAAHDPAEFAKRQRWLSEVHANYCGRQQQQQQQLGDDELHMKVSVSRARRSRDHYAHDREREREQFGRVVFSPDNSSSVWPKEPDWGALAAAANSASGRLAGELFHQEVSVQPRLADAYCTGGNVSTRKTGQVSQCSLYLYLLSAAAAGEKARGSDSAVSQVRCQPSPDAFSPCEDLLGNWALRGAAWAVGLAALLGNLAVLAVLLAARFRLSVPKLLMCNLALADLCMGLYLLMLAAVDARSLGQYFNYAIDWQKGKRQRELLPPALRSHQQLDANINVYRELS
ncbi:follicle-stimulating hormone receptor-like [Schistocerca americana]|uniref:follicle-stimulating hormone receptor-like n=1 Tax=Schistocerca americana TaxID=7009 RepID=UPI001F502348|nr:follicle-stimulating hormone receptor-like [Schistocerca americana]